MGVPRQSTLALMSARDTGRRSRLPAQFHPRLAAADAALSDAERRSSLSIEKFSFANIASLRLHLLGERFSSEL